MNQNQLELQKLTANDTEVEAQSWTVVIRTVGKNVTGTTILLRHL